MCCLVICASIVGNIYDKMENKGDISSGKVISPFSITYTNTRY
jgi:hypothetical protein